MKPSTRFALRRALVLLMLLTAALYGLKRIGWIAPDTGAFAAVDGDSLRKGETEYRLNGIDAPELNQTCKDAGGGDYPCGREARSALRRLTSGRALDCLAIDTDRYGRNVVLCKAGEIDINAQMVRDGWAIAYRKHSLAYVADEKSARAARRGIWQGSFETPEDWRDRHRDSLVRGDASAIDELAD